MIYKNFKDEKLSLLGFGCMRLPINPDTKEIDEVQTEKMFDYAVANGVNYFDTAFPYHGGKSELVVGKILKKYPRDSFYLATKYPGHQLKPGLIDDSMMPEALFKKQLEKCGVDYFDFYLLHNVCENSMDIYKDKQYGIIDYFVKMREEGKIKHLGFSSHGGFENLEEFLKLYGDKMEFCQIQLNYVDWTLQKAKEKYELLEKYGIGIWVMEPVRGGKLASFAPELEAKLKAARPDESIPAWAFRWLQGKGSLNMILSGMSSFAQVEDNIKSFAKAKPVTEDEQKLLDEVVKRLADFVPCTACRYCTKECPQELDIPALLAAYNDMAVNFSYTPSMFIETLPDEKKPSACLGCGACEGQCPQGIKISEVMSKLADMYANHDTWTKICETRYKEAQGLK